MLILPISKDFHKLLENSDLATVALLCELCRVVVVAVDVAVMLVIAVLSAEYRIAEGTSKVVDMVLAVQRCDV